MSDGQQQARLNENADDTLTQQVHQQFLAERKKKTKYVRLVQLAILLLFFIFWEMAARLKWIDVLLFSYPTKVFKLLWDKLLDGSLLPHVGVTVVETIIGFVLGTLFGTALAVVIWWSPFLSRVLDPYIVVLNSMPKVALGPLFIVGLGPGLLSIIATTLSITVIITTLVVYGSFKEVDNNYVKVVTLFGGNQRKVFLKAILPASFPAIVSTLKVNVGLAWIGVIVGEFLVSQMGLGYLIIYGFQVFNFTLVISTLFVIAIVATVMYQIVSNLEKRMTKHR
ncbi:MULTISPECIES: ABC transporter permease [unclassified Paenibacillus]|jgi:NitT/TauT family transport system permease protein|uniref:ABC transporter permease n=1 Tax=unclassified Paenibacillus TaxID=185978 RepID=UPI00070DC881|nr:MULTISPECIES: ABC transporter permease [unclassified Paenibacillus]KQX67943.1 ABC transporter permease [Paenibacillus sp. Root444D2]KRE49391.1 ABC transporter permease [Paenibacillus sp. Soil724D2]